MSDTLPAECPFCYAEGTLYIDGREIVCRLCGHRERRPELDITPRDAPRRKLQASFRIDYKGPLDPWARAAFDTGQDCIRREDWDGALKAFERALDCDREFLDAHLWIARLTSDPVKKRDHLTSLLAHDPNHLEAIRELMVLDGRMTQEEADRTYHHDGPEQRRVGLPVEAESVVLKCPVCEGDLTVDSASQRVECRFCGYSDVYVPRRVENIETLTMALLHHKAQSVEWVVGERFLHCNNCGAERTLSGTTLSTRCPFCGSNHVIERDTLGSFQQPDGLVRFQVSKREAAAAIKTRLDSWTERVKGWFDNNKVSRGRLESIYLPFWVFDSIVEVTRSTIDKRTGQGRIAQVHPESRETIAELVNNLPICAVKSPPPYLTAQLGRFDFNLMVSYAPELLAEYPAQLYNINFDDASLEARSVIGKHMREKHGQTYSDEVQVNIFSGVQQMTFQLVLLPVWVATLVEHDGDIRPALVNGQTGHVVLGRAGKPPA